MHRAKSDLLGNPPNRCHAIHHNKNAAQLVTEQRVMFSNIADSISGSNRSVLRCESLLRLGNDGGEGCGIGDREIREDLAVSFDSGSFQAFNETRISHILVAAGGVNTLRPQTAELTFALLPVPIFIRQRFSDGVLGVTEEFRAETAETLGTEQRPLAAGATGR